MNTIQNIKTKSHIVTSIILVGIILGIAVSFGGGTASFHPSNSHPENNNGKDIELTYEPHIVTPKHYHVYVIDNSVIPESAKPNLNK